MFYDKFIYLCDVKKTSPSRAAVEAGISKSLVTKWKTNKTTVPSPEILRKLSSYFNVTVSELLSEQEDKKEKAPGEFELTEGERAMIELFRLIPEDRQQAALDLLKAALKMQ